MKVIIEEAQWNDIDDEIESFIKNYKTDIPIGMLDLGDGKFWQHLYNHQVITLSDKFNAKLFETIDSMMDNPDVKYDLFQAWLNQISEDSNQNDAFHRDVRKDIVLLHYPKFNEEFDGGQLQWIENENTPNQIIKEFKPEFGKSYNILLLECPQHRVKNVTKGTRYSFVFFCHKRRDKRFI
jgi:hypothetical protein